jgi:hypothetical protein
MGVLERFGMIDSKTVSTPLPENIKLSIPLSKEDNDWTLDMRILNGNKKSKYQQLIGSLTYTALGTRPDIAFATQRLACYNAEPCKSHWKAAKHILRYLNGTQDLRILYDGASNSGLIAWCNSDWAIDRDNQKSTTGFVCFMANGAIAWTF